MTIPVFDELKTSVRRSGLPVRYIAYRAGVSPLAIRKWLRGEVSFPRIDTMLKVATVLGQHIELTPTVKKMLAYYPRREIKPPPVVPVKAAGMSHPNFYGSLGREAMKLELLGKTGHRVPMKRASSNARKTDELTRL